jgi:dolichol-phosphate mannosyltransferase
MLRNGAGPNTTSTNVSIVVPTFKEAENLPLLIPRIAEAMRGMRHAYEVIVVDDDSRDGTDEVVRRLGRYGYPVRLITRHGERGLSSAVIRGFSEAKGELFVCMDADLSHPPATIPKLLEALENSACDLVIGSRYAMGGSTDEAWGLFRWLNSKVATLLARPFCSAKDPMSGFFATRSTVLERCAWLNPVGYKIALEIVVKCDCRNVCEVPIRFANRKHGESKLSLREQINYLRHLKRLADFKYGDLSRFTQFAMVGATGVVVDLTTYASLLALSVPLTVARALGIWVAMSWNFILHRHFTFAFSRVENIRKQYWRFVTSCGLGAVISWSVAVSLPYASEFFSRVPLLAAGLGIVAGTVSNFLLSRHWVFRRRVGASRVHQRSK